MSSKRAGKPRAGPLDQRISLSVAEAAEALGVSEAHLRNNLPDVPHFHLGSRVLFPVDALREWAARQAAGQRDQVGQEARDLLRALE